MGHWTSGQKWMAFSTAATGVLLMAGVFSQVNAVRAADAAPNAEGVKFFEAKIRPILAEHCVGCHGSEKHKGDLRLDTRENMLKGGKDDDDKPLKVVEPGNPDKSLIIEAINYKNEDLQMPPQKKKQSMKLSDEQIKDMTQWVKMGVPYGDKPVEAVKKE